MTYCNDTLGMAFESPVSKGIQSWWSDCYGECPRMFYQAFAGVPQFAPSHENHILYSPGILNNVNYAVHAITYETTSPGDNQYLRFNFKPLQVTLNGLAVPFDDTQAKKVTL